MAREREHQERTRRTAPPGARLAACERDREAMTRGRAECRAERQRERERHRDLGVCAMKPPDPVFVSSSAALLALQIKEASL
jgi:hypothetical protein